MKKTILLSLVTAGAANAATIMFNEANVAATDSATTVAGNLVQTFTQVSDLDGDGVDDTLTYTLTTAAEMGDVAFPGVQYAYRTEGGNYTLSLDVVDYVGSAQGSTLESFDAELTGFFKSGNEGYTLTDGTDTFEASTATVGNNVNVTLTDNLDFSDGGNSLTIFGNGNSGLANLDFSFTAVTSVPEPSSTALLGLGGLAMLLRRRR